jgi:hypothetical protein
VPCATAIPFDGVVYTDGKMLPPPSRNSVLTLVLGEGPARACVGRETRE